MRRQGRESILIIMANSELHKLIRVVIVEDNAYMREGWQSVLDADSKICVLNTFGSCEAALSSGEYKQADLILLDIGLPGMKGTDGVTEFLKDKPGLSIIMATVFEDDSYVFEALENGAVGYLSKNVSPSELIRAVKDAYDGGSPMSPKIARKVIGRVQKKKFGKTEYDLTDREVEVLTLLAAGKSYAGIAKTIFLSVDGVSYHIRNIYRKLQVKNKSKAISKGIAEGIIEL